MADSPAHRFGQVIGDLLEEIMRPLLQSFCDQRGLYLDKKGPRGDARHGKKVSWEDKYGNAHDLDFVIEKGGTPESRGRPLAFIETAWRRYTKHSRNKAQEIQGAILPIAEKHLWDKPFLGAILAGVFTGNSLTQMRSSGFEVALFPYESIVAAFRSVGIDAEFDEDTPDALFAKSLRKIDALSVDRRSALKEALVHSNQVRVDRFLQNLRKALDRCIDAIILIPLHGTKAEFMETEEAIDFVEKYGETASQNHGFQKYEVIIKYSNGDAIDASFANKERAIEFLRYTAGGVLR